jgi:hypothetical protein
MFITGLRVTMNPLLLVLSWTSFYIRIRIFKYAEILTKLIKFIFAFSDFVLYGDMSVHCWC